MVSAEFSCAVANCVRVASKIVEAVAVNGQPLEDPIPLRVCSPCFAYYGLVEAPQQNADVTFVGTEAAGARVRELRSRQSESGGVPGGE